ncbi:MAE_28990/MAE_18760 family HEPN-like nuclease [Vibrio diabolicus]|uniref:MAE_28990/MAE_18760 family HEPN-like nuclease n=1 Tax=Vibrio diabolicus TaxID=50719 RepID=UPI00215DF201|nr:MAE_28990/MAE_18760 family HEPN-like nuclease [Vibrio diabolicus]MCS0387312.1 MAE_28990/MAE_18760 family HEPN-like nuclease [Vibrio diabolicus]
MSIKKLERFHNKLDKDLGWRKHEISHLLSLENDDNSIVVVKATLLLLYSHWEGFIKNASKEYLKFISDKKIKLHDLNYNFEAISLKGRYKELENSKNSLTLESEINFLEDIYCSSIFCVDSSVFKNEQDKSIINTKDNLNLSVYKNILKIIGFGNVIHLDDRDDYISNILLQNRNIIAHGNKIDEHINKFELNREDILKMKNFLFVILDNLVKDIKYFSENELYLFSKRNKIEAYVESSYKSLSIGIKAIFNENIPRPILSFD